MKEKNKKPTSEEQLEVYPNPLVKAEPKTTRGQKNNLARKRWYGKLKNY